MSKADTEIQGVECPYCPKTIPKDAPNDGRPAESAMAQHVSQSTDHPQMTHQQALEAVERYNSPGGAPPEGSKGSGDPVADELADEDPAMNAPDVPTETTPACPDCRATLDAVDRGTELAGEWNGTVVEFESDGDDYRCDDCQLVVTGAGQVVRDIQNNE